MTEQIYPDADDQSETPDPNNNPKSVYTYDSSGNRTSETDQHNELTAYT
jgi:hypothetical protein